MNIVFMGTPTFAAYQLNTILSHPDYLSKVKAVYTQPDKPKGRKKILTPSEVKKTALIHNVKIEQVPNFQNKTDIEKLALYKPDIIIVVAYGLILPKEVLSIPTWGCLNIHASILPKYRGASPIHDALINNDEETGVSSMLMDEGIDTGKVLKIEKIKISPSDDISSLSSRLEEAGAMCLINTLEHIKENPNDQGTSQESQFASYSKKIKKSHAIIDFKDDSISVHNRIRALNFWPVCRIQIPIKETLLPLKIYKSSPYSNDEIIDQYEPGTLLTTEQKKIYLKLKTGFIELLEVQLPGKKRMITSHFLNGTPLPQIIKLTQEITSTP